MCANCEAINGPASRRMAQSSVRAGCCMVITLDRQREPGKRSILGALRRLHKGIKRMGGMIKTHPE